MGFSQRLEPATRFEQQVADYLRANIYISAIVENGTEHTHPEFVERLRQNERAAAKFIRFAPDGVALKTDQTVFHWEAKASINIEKDAFATYMTYHQMGCRVLIFFKLKAFGRVLRDEARWQSVEKIEFTDSNIVVGRFDPDKRFPIDEDGWICPRKACRSAGFGSGTPYKEVNIESLNTIRDFFIST